MEPVALGQLAFSAMPAADLVASFAAAFDAAPPVPGSIAAATTAPAVPTAAPAEAPVIAAPVPAPFTAPPVFSLTTPEPTPVPAPVAVAPAAPVAPAPVAAAAPAPVRDLSTMPPPAYTPPLAVAAPVPALAAPVPAPAPDVAPSPAPAEPVAEAPQLASPLPPPTANGLVMTPAPAPIAIAPIAAAAGTATSDLPDFATAAVATIPQYASQLQPATETSLGQPVAAWDAIPAGTPSLFSPAPLPSASTSFRNAPPPTPGTAMSTAPSWVNGGYEKPVAPPSNGKATAGFVLSLLGVTLVGLFVSIGGLRKARELESMGMPPVGRTLARWGVGISTVSIVATIILVSFIATVGTAMFPILQTNGLLTGSGTTPVTITATPSVFEASVWDALTIETDLDVDTVDCPATASTEPGSVVDCSVTLVDGEVVSVRTTFADDGSRTTEQLT